MTDSIQAEVAMGSRLSEIPALIQRLRSDSELLAPVRGREADFLIAMREARANGLAHDNQSDASKRVFVSCGCELTQRCRSWYGMMEMGSIRSIFPQRMRAGKTRKWNLAYQVFDGRSPVSKERL
jgi:hypothetical protein